MAGVTFRGHLPQRDQTVALAEPVFRTAILTSRGLALKYALQGGTVHATFPGAADLPAVIGHRLDQGRSLLFAFDLIGSLQQNSAWGAVFDAALDELQPVLPDTYPGAAWLPVALDVENAGPAVTVLATARWPAGFALEEVPADAVLDGAGRPQWTFDLAPSARKTLALNLRAPAATGTYAIAFDVVTRTGGSEHPYGTAQVDVTVQAAAQAGPPLLAAIRALTPQPAVEREARDHAVRVLDCGLAALAGSGHPSCAAGEDNDTQARRALRHFLTAADQLASILTVPVDTLQNGLALLVAEAEHRACQSGTERCLDQDKSATPASGKRKAP